MKFRTILASGSLVLLIACGSLGVKPETFNEGVAACLSSATATRVFAGSLLSADTITPDEAENANQQADVLRNGCDVASQLKSVDLRAAEGKLDATRIAIGALRDYLEDRR